MIIHEVVARAKEKYLGDFITRLINPQNTQYSLQHILKDSGSTGKVVGLSVGIPLALLALICCITCWIER